MLSTYLHIDKPLKKAPVLICEGWIPDYAYKEVIDVYRAGNYQLLLVTGNHGRSKILRINHQADIILSDLPFIEENKENHIEIVMSGHKYDTFPPDVKIYKNDSLLHSKTLVSRTEVRIDSKWLPDDSLKLSMVNGATFPDEPQNIFRIQSIHVNDQPLPLLEQKIMIGRNGELFRFNASYKEERLSEYIRTKDIQSIETLSSSRLGVSKTYNAASDAIKWLKKHGYTSANVLTYGAHSRRTYVSYKKADPNFQIGIIALATSWKPPKRMVAREILGISLIKLLPQVILDKKWKIRPNS